MDGPERSPHAKLSCEVESSFLSEVSLAFVRVRMFSANQIAVRFLKGINKRINK